MSFSGFIFVRANGCFGNGRPMQTALFFVGDMTDWRETKAFELERIDQEGVWEIRFPAEILVHKMHYRLHMHWKGGEGDRIPAYARAGGTGSGVPHLQCPGVVLRLNPTGGRPMILFPLRGLFLSMKPMWAWPRKKKKSAHIVNLPSTSCRGLLRRDIMPCN